MFLAGTNFLKWRIKPSSVFPLEWTLTIFLLLTFNHLFSIEMWGHVLFWAFLLTTLTYVTVGIMYAVCLRLQKGVSCLVPLGYLCYGQLSVLTTDAIASECLSVSMRALAVCRKYLISLNTNCTYFTWMLLFNVLFVCLLSFVLCLGHSTSSLVTQLFPSVGSHYKLRFAGGYIRFPNMLNLVLWLHVVTLPLRMWWWCLWKGGCTKALQVHSCGLCTCDFSSWLIRVSHCEMYQLPGQWIPLP